MRLLVVDDEPAVREALQRILVELFVPRTQFGGPSGVAQVVDPAGDVIASDPSGRLPVDAALRAVARGERQAFLRDERVDGVHVRVFTTRDETGAALQVARPLTEVDATLGRLRWILVLVTAAGGDVRAGEAVQEVVEPESLRSTKRAGASAAEPPGTGAASSAAAASSSRCCAVSTSAASSSERRSRNARHGASRIGRGDRAARRRRRAAARSARTSALQYAQ